VKEDVHRMMKIVDKCLLKEKFSYPMNRNAPQPDKPFAAVRLAFTHVYGYDKREYYENEVGYFMKTTGLRKLEFDILFSHDDVDPDDFRNSFYRPDVLQLCKESGLVVMGTRNLNNRDKTFETDWATRTGVRVDCNVVREQITPIEYFNVVEIEGDYNEGEHVTHIGPIIVKGDNE